MAVIRVLFRIIGTIILVIGLAGLAGLGAAIFHDMWQAPLGQVWVEQSWLGTNSLFTIGSLLSGGEQDPAQWNPGVVTLLGWPAWLALGLVGFAALFLGGVMLKFTRRRQRQNNMI